MERLSKIFFILFVGVFTSPEAFSEDIGDSLRLNCSLFIAKFNGSRPVVDIDSQPVILGYSDESDPNDLQPIFILSQMAPEASFLQRRAILARLIETEAGYRILEVGFYNAQIRFQNSLSVGVLQHPTLSSWQFEPVFVDRFYLPHEENISFDIDVNDHRGSSITGNTHYSMVNLNCSN